MIYAMLNVYQMDTAFVTANDEAGFRDVLRDVVWDCRRQGAPLSLSVRPLGKVAGKARFNTLLRQQSLRLCDDVVDRKAVLLGQRLVGS